MHYTVNMRHGVIGLMLYFLIIIHKWIEGDLVDQVAPLHIVRVRACDLARTVGRRRGALVLLCRPTVTMPTPLKHA